MTMNLPKEERELYQAFLALSSVNECYAFIRDLCTPAEIKSMQERWLVAQLLHQTKLSYREIHDKTGVSIATITRVARFLHHEKYLGYKTQLDNKAKKEVPVAA